MDISTIILGLIGAIQGGGDPLEAIADLANDLFVGGQIDQARLDLIDAARMEARTQHSAMAAEAREILRRRAEAAGDGG